MVVCYFAKTNWLCGILSKLLESCLIYRHEVEAIKRIVKEISLKLRSIHLSNDENVIGMDRGMQDMESALGIGLNDKARMIGIKGMGGIGETTLARAILDNVSVEHDSLCGKQQYFY